MVPPTWLRVALTLATSSAHVARHKQTTYARLLPFVTVDDASEPVTASLKQDAKWWLRVGDHVYFTPPSALGLSSDVSHYYHAVGSPSALTKEMSLHRVGGLGRHHIFHFPDGISSLPQTMPSNTGDRRTSFSALTQLSGGTTLHVPFPLFQPSADYVHPLRKRAQGKERRAVAKIRSETIMSDLQQLVKLPNADLPSRSHADATSSEAAQHWLQAQLRDIGLNSCLHKFSEGTTNQANVVASVRGETRDSVTVGAHYDSRPFEKDEAAPGAEDNGSGVAALLSIARAFKATGMRPKKTVHIVFFASEESGMLGSDHFASELKDNGKVKCQQGLNSEKSSFLQISLDSDSLNVSDLRPSDLKHQALILDEVGWKSPKVTGKAQANLESYDSSGEVMQHLAQSSKLHNGDALVLEHSSNPFGSDHMSFLGHSMPAVLSINSFDEEYPNYHKSSDVISDTNINPELLTLITKMNAGALIRMAGERRARRGQMSALAQPSARGRFLRT